MDFPIITKFLSTATTLPLSVTLERFEKAVKTIEEGLETKHIWNVDYEAAKYTLSNTYEKIGNALYDPLRTLYHHGDHHWSRDWADNDPRHNLGYSGSGFLNAPGYLKKLKLVKKAPELADYIAMLTEVAQLAEMVKAVKPYIEKGRKPSENPVEKDVTNTGICPVCFKRQKLTFESTLVAHGYTVPRGWGGRNGMCFGRSYPAFELSNKGTLAFIEYMRKVLAGRKTELTKLRNSEHLELSEIVSVRKERGRYVDELRTYQKGTDPYEKVRQKHIWSAESDIRSLTADIKEFTSRAQAWKEQPLKYGGAETQERWKNRLLNKA